MTITKEKSSPQPDQILETAALAALPSQLLYTLAACFLVFSALHEGAPGYGILQWGLCALCLWLIHCARRVLCVLEEECMTVTVRPTRVGDMAAWILGRAATLVVPYEAVSGVTADWRELYLVTTDGTLVAVPVAWDELSKRDRGYILRRVAQRRDDREDMS